MKWRSGQTTERWKRLIPLRRSELPRMKRGSVIPDREPPAERLKFAVAFWRKRDHDSPTAISAGSQSG